MGFLACHVGSIADEARIQVLSDYFFEEKVMFYIWTYYLENYYILLI